MIRKTWEREKSNLTGKLKKKSRSRNWFSTTLTSTPGRALKT